jgi:hypothetical protein
VSLEMSKKQSGNSDCSGIFTPNPSASRLVNPTEGTALLVHPFSTDWYVGGSVLVQGRHGSIVEITVLPASTVYDVDEGTGGMVWAGG